MSEILLDSTRTLGPMKRMHAVNNGPLMKRPDQTRGNFDEFAAARIPFARNHDAAFNAAYGGEHTVDVNFIFPDFSRDPDDPTAYDFTLTDQYLRNTLDAGTGVFYRLGSKIEHWIKKYNTLPPKDFQKWAEICEHIIAHYNEGWADGHRWDIAYWEIWNEPDLDPDDSPNKRCWGGTADEFFQLYRITARHLKRRFPNLRIGGPALAHRFDDWTDRFLASLTADGERTPLDFFSWHVYTTDPRVVGQKARLVRDKLDRAGYPDAESILNEWNYVRGWTKDFVYTIRQIIGAKGAAFTAACMAVGQDSPVDMLMYYDARPCPFNGLFDFYTLERLKGYWPFYGFADLYDLGTQISAVSDDPDIYCVAATDGNGRLGLIVAHYAENDTAEPAKTVLIKAAPGGALPSPTAHVVDDARSYAEAFLQRQGDALAIRMPRNSIAFIT